MRITCGIKRVDAFAKLLWGMETEQVYGRLYGVYLRLMLPHEVCKLTVLGVKLDNAYPVLNFLSERNMTSHGDKSVHWAGGAGGGAITAW